MIELVLIGEIPKMPIIDADELDVPTRLQRRNHTQDDQVLTTITHNCFGKDHPFCY